MIPKPATKKNLDKPNSFVVKLVMIKEKTLLQTFIENYSKSYHPPIGRAGIKRGEKIGYSQVKYEASLYSALTSKTLKDIAIELKVKYGVLKLWRIEKDFQALIEQHRRHFSGFVWGALHKKTGKLRDYAEDVLLKKDIREIWDTKLPSINFDEFRDSATYNPKVFESIYHRIFVESDYKSHELFPLSFIFLNFIKVFFPSVFSIKLWKEIKIITINQIRMFLEEIGDSKKEALFYLKLLYEMEKM